MNHVSNPLISVLIPVYNHEIYVEECIRSIWEQNCSQVEIIAIDDGSRDTSFEVLQRLKVESPVPMYIERQANQGVVRTANKLLGLARGEYILCMASDDKILPGALARAIHELLQRDGVSFAMFSAMYFGRVNKPVYSQATDKLFDSGVDKILRRLYVDPPKPILLQSTIVSRDVFISIGGWDQNVVMDDWPIFIRLFEYVLNNNSYFFYNGKLFLSGYRIHNSNSHINTAKQISMFEGVIDNYCPMNLRSEAYANTFVDFSLNLIRRKNIESLKLLKKAVNVSSLFVVMKLLFLKIYNYIIR